MNETTKHIVDKVQQIATDHSSVKFFDFSLDGTFLFRNNAEVDKFPILMLQLLDATQTGQNVTRTFGLYCLDEVNPDYDYTRANDFDYDDTRLQLEDSTKQIINDVIGRLKEENQQDLIITQTTGSFQNNVSQGVTGWRQDFTVETLNNYNDNNFPA